MKILDRLERLNRDYLLADEQARSCDAGNLEAARDALLQEALPALIRVARAAERTAELYKVADEWPREDPLEGAYAQVSAEAARQELEEALQLLRELSGGEG